MAPLSKEEALVDFEEIVAKFKGLYGPLEYKEKRFAYRFGDLVAEARRELTDMQNDQDVFAVFNKLLTKLQDGHVSLSFPYSHQGVYRYKVPLFATPLADKFAIAHIDASIKDEGIDIGDELLEVDGKSPEELLDVIKSYETMGNGYSDRHAVYAVFNRSSFMKELIPTKDTVDIKVRKADGSEYETSLLWRVLPFFEDKLFASRVPKTGSHGQFHSYVAAAHRLNDSAQGSMLQMGASTPFFLSDAVKEKFELKDAVINADFQKKYGLDREKYNDIYAATYTFEGKKFLLVRLPSYSLAAEGDYDRNINVYRAILDQYDDQVEGLIIDQNHNPGGRLDYVTNFFRLFITSSKAPNLVQASNADRQWVMGYKASAEQADFELKKEDSLRYLNYSKLVEIANEKGDPLSPALPMIGAEWLRPDSKYVFKKPVVLLADELAGSCGDILPMLMKRSGRAKIFGQRTMGLGGNVELVAVLTSTGAELRLTRGLFNSYRTDGVYPEESWVENRGIAPDHPYSLTLDDFRSSYVNYFQSAAAYLLGQIESH
jgi:C-terminal processing protease CtpA/Prc